jgi:hypothetical protein
MLFLKFKSVIGLSIFCFSVLDHVNFSAISFFVGQHFYFILNYAFLLSVIFYKEISFIVRCICCIELFTKKIRSLHQDDEFAMRYGAQDGVQILSSLFSLQQLLLPLNKVYSSPYPPGYYSSNMQVRSLKRRTWKIKQTAGKEFRWCRAVCIV